MTSYILYKASKVLSVTGRWSIVNDELLRTTSIRDSQHLAMAAFRKHPQTFLRRATTVATNTKAEGDISSVFPSLSGKAPEPLPVRFKELKSQLVRGREKEIAGSWFRLLSSLQEEIRKIKQLGSDVTIAPDNILSSS